MKGCLPHSGGTRCRRSADRLSQGAHQCHIERRRPQQLKAIVVARKEPSIELVTSVDRGDLPEPVHGDSGVLSQFSGHKLGKQYLGLIGHGYLWQGAISSLCEPAWDRTMVHSTGGRRIHEMHVEH